MRCSILIDVYFIYFHLWFVTCFGEHVHRTIVPVPVTSAYPVLYTHRLPAFDTLVLDIEVVVLKDMTGAYLKCVTFRALEFCYFSIMIISSLHDVFHIRNGIIITASTIYDRDSRVPFELALAHKGYE